jgi:hypothetical protein
VIGLAFFELAKVYFIMPMPGSQRMKSLDAAYALHTWRWAFRLVALVAIGGGMRAAFAVGMCGVRFPPLSCSAPQVSGSTPRS